MEIKLFNKKTEKRDSDISEWFNAALTYNTFSDYTSSYAMKISAVNRAVNIISDSIATLPIQVTRTNKDGYTEIVNNHYLEKILNNKPNELMTKFQFIKRLLIDVMIKGNGFAYIERNEFGGIESLKYLRATNTNIKYNEQTGKLYYTSTQVNGIIEPCNMIHFKMHTNNGVEGISVLSYAHNSLMLQYEAEKAASNFYKSGMALNGILKSDRQLRKEQKQEAINNWNQLNNGTGGGIAVLDAAFDFQSISISSKEAQLLETREFGIDEIARFFGVPSSKLLDYSHNTYSSLEMANMDFLSNCLNGWIIMIEQELTNKLFLPSQNYKINIDETEILKTDKQATANYYSILLQNGVLSINEVRHALGYGEIEGGNKNIIAYTKIEDNTINKEEKKDEN